MMDSIVDCVADGSGCNEWDMPYSMNEWAEYDDSKNKTTAIRLLVVTGNHVQITLDAFGLVKSFISSTSTNCSSSTSNHRPS